MMFKQSQLGKKMMPLLALFTVINIGFINFGAFWDKNGIRHEVVIVGNALLFLLGVLSLFMHLNAIKKPNPHVFVRSVMAGTFLKMITVGTAAVLYLKLYKGEKSKAAVIATMILYLLYTLIEVKTATALNKKQ